MRPLTGNFGMPYPITRAAHQRAQNALDGFGKMTAQFAEDLADLLGHEDYPAALRAMPRLERVSGALRAALEETEREYAALKDAWWRSHPTDTAGMLAYAEQLEQRTPVVAEVPELVIPLLLTLSHDWSDPEQFAGTQGAALDVLQALARDGFPAPGPGGEWTVLARYVGFGGPGLGNHHFSSHPTFEAAMGWADALSAARELPVPCWRNLQQPGGPPVWRAEDQTGFTYRVTHEPQERAAGPRQCS